MKTKVENSERYMWAGIAVASMVIGLVVGATIIHSPKDSYPASSLETSIIQGGAKDLVLDSLRLQATARASDAKYDSAQRETIKLLIPTKLEEFSSKPLAVSDLSGIEAMYSLIAQPDGLRATRK